MEALFSENQTLVYFIGVFYIFINDSFDKKQKISIVYIFSYILKLFGIMSLKVMLTILVLTSFLYIGFLSSDSLKNSILGNMWCKFKDYIYKVVFEYSALYFILSIILLSNLMQEKIPILTYANIDISIIGIKINIISILIFIYTLNNIVSQKYETITFDAIKKKMDDVAIWSKTTITEDDKRKLELLVDIEDKSYFYRKNSYNFFSFEFLKYKINRRKIKYAIQNINVKEVLFKDIPIKRMIKKMRTYIRGYSTIEMQIIRTLGVQYGYEHVFCRKIYELLYSKMFFKNLRKRLNKVHLNTKGCCSFKEFLLIVYINIAQIKINGKRYKNILEFYNKNNISEIDIEEFFIGILGLSGRKINEDIIENYERVILKHGLDMLRIEEIIRSIS